MLRITSHESLDSAAADVVRLKIDLTKRTAAKDAEIAKIEKAFDAATLDLRDRIAALEADCAAYCEARRSDPELFRDGAKSRETSLCTLGFRTTPPRVETTNRKIKWADVVTRLSRLAWGKAYLRQSLPTVDKEALLADRQTLSEDRQNTAGIRFVQDEIFFLDPKPETAQIGGE